MIRAALALFVPLVAIGCTSEQTQIGVGEPFRVRAAPEGAPAAQFIKGKLPGTQSGAATAPAGTASDGDADAAVQGPPHIIEFTTATAAVVQGQANVGVKGTTTPNAFSVGFELDGVSSGYWVVPVAAIDVNGIDRDWQIACDFDDTIPPGYHDLKAVAFDESGTPGEQRPLSLCIDSALPDNLNACSKPGKKALPPPFAVIALKWDTNVDLDLQVLTPEGRLVEPKNPLLTELDASAAKTQKTFDAIDRDSNGGCVIDAIREEDLVFETAMPHGGYQIFANLFDACKQPSVRFRVEVYLSQDVEGGQRLVQYYPRPVDPPGGELLDISANGGAARGLFVTAFNF
jgi:hypothetical protein